VRKDKEHEERRNVTAGTTNTSTPIMLNYYYRAA
jgi:hypothetical protein